MKVLLISNIFPPGFVGGYELGALDVVRGLRARGHEVRVLTSNYFPSDGGDDDVHRTLSCTPWNHERSEPDPISESFHSYPNLRVLGAHLREFDPDVVVAFNCYGLGTLSLLGFLGAVRVPTVLYLMDNVFSGIDRTAPITRAYERVFGRIDLASGISSIVMSGNVRRSCEASLGGPLSVAATIPGWVDHGDDVSDEPSPTRDESRRFVFISRIAPHKGTIILLDACKRLVEAGTPNFDVDIYGAGQVGPLLQQIAWRGLNERVHYRGTVAKSEVLQVLAHHDALVFPTWESEAFGFVAAEAAAAGCLPILTAGIGASEWFLDGHDSLKITRSADDLCMAMTRVLSADAAELNETRRRIRVAARSSFSFDRWLPVIEAICRDAAATRKRRTNAEIRAVESSFLYLGTMLREAAAP